MHCTEADNFKWITAIYGTISCKFKRFGAKDVTKHFKFTQSGAMDAPNLINSYGLEPCLALMNITSNRLGPWMSPNPVNPNGFGASDVTKPYEFKFTGAMDGTKPYKFK